MSATRLEAWISGVGVVGPGLVDWPSTRAVLAGEQAYLHQPTALVAPALLPAAERRRTGRAVRLALAVGLEAIADAELDPAQLATVFTSSGGDGENCHLICEALASDDRQISPTRFHNSVHNAPAGYWSIATGAMAPSSCLCSFDASFAAGLFEAMVQATADEAPVALLAYDTGYPEPLLAVRPIAEAFGVSMVISPRAPARGWKLTAWLSDAPAQAMPDTTLEGLRQTIPAARALPLLQALAGGKPTTVTLSAWDDVQLTIEVAAC
ncbi:MAG TPA: beta-ketoacyl synthase chain length factor [Rhodocyclaceae bacterium]